MSANTYHELEGLFYPKNMAVVGASQKTGILAQGGNGFIEGAFNLNFPGKIYPVNPKAESLLGFKSYRSVRDIPDEVDLVIFAVPYKIAIQVMQDCVTKHVKFAHIFTAGFSETGYKENIEIEKKLVRLARDGGVRVVGPNCMGLYCPEGKIAWSKGFPREPGNIGFLSQSGQLASQFITDGQNEGLRFSKVVSFGNASDLQCHDFLNYFAQDNKTKIIGSYLEGLKDGEAFFNEAQKLTRKKPLVVWKGGQTEGGSRATLSHTASIAGSMQIWQAVCKQSGIILVNSMEELIATITAMHRTPLPNGIKVAILGSTVGSCVTMTDDVEGEGLHIPQPLDETILALDDLIPMREKRINNPLDILNSKMLSPISLSEQERIISHFMQIFKLLIDDPNMDAVIYIQRLEMIFKMGGHTLIDLFVRMTCEGIKESKKPVFVVLKKSNTLEEEAILGEVRGMYNNNGIVIFPSLKRAARTLRNMNQYKKYLASYE